MRTSRLPTLRGPAAPELLETARLALRRPVAGDVSLIYTTYASDGEVTRYLGWPRHTHLDDTRAFVAFSDSEWGKWGCGPYLAFSPRDSQLLIGSTGLAFETPDVAQTGYVVRRDSWGLGFATEMLQAMVELAKAIGVERLYAQCHVDHDHSRHVMEKCGFTSEGLLPARMVFPNLGPHRADVLCYSMAFSR
jgi:ribosomal-protein-alanine N-acetyltransferase